MLLRRPESVFRCRAARGRFLSRWVIRGSALGWLADIDHAVCRFLVGLFPLVIIVQSVDYAFERRSGFPESIFADPENVIYSPAITAVRAGFP
ncbi:hypothetical protein QRX60_04225 [Amycolatopsis mongoliensis]|uniref:Uncharacterized protein n=1 Tax=Amycolatopsis mongoliensis TaxID=715475 RepID=A0A9Y2JR12_9PSEU|nr:hypothetical protein [Amycolatopsis sp. 4-36]WIY03080.1 hypothetical protein QRX60_04225 [Amycolatopsis sp. 4-36]